MKKVHNNILLVAIPFLALSLLSSCSNNEVGKPGYEFMPDMYRSPSLEIYSSNTFFKDSLNARQPVAGTMPRGFVAFEYDNTLEDYLLAGKELKNPFENTDENVEKGKQLFVGHFLWFFFLPYPLRRWKGAPRGPRARHSPLPGGPATGGS